MANNLATSGSTFAASDNAAFGQVFSAGNAMLSPPAPLLTAVPFTLECWITTTSTSTGKRVAGGQYYAAWIGCNGAFASCAYGAANTEILSSIAINDGLRHHLEMVVTATEARLFVDGVLAGTSTSAPVCDFTSRNFALRTLNLSGGTSTSNTWIGTVDEFAVWSTARHTAAFTPPTAPYTGSESGLFALYHLDGNANDSVSAPVADTTAPTASAAAVANGAPTVVAITMSEVMDSATVPPASAFTVGGHAVSSVAISGAGINLTVSTAFVNGEAARTVAYVKPASGGARDVAGNLLESFSNLAITNNVSAAGDTTPPAFASAQVTNSQPNIILVTMNETLAASVPPASAFAPSGGRTATAVSVSGLVASVTVDTPYAYGDVVTIAYTRPAANPRLQDAAGNATATFAAQPVTNNIAAPTVNNAYDATKILFSPYTWDAGATRAKTVNAGAYFRTIFGGPSCTLNFDVSAAKAPYTQLMYRVDGTGPWITVDLAASITITVPSETSGYATHYLEVRVKATAMSTTYSIWPAVSAAAVIITGVILAAGQTLTLPVARPLRALVYGDSITVGYRSLNGGESTVSSDASQTGAFVACEAMNAEFGIVAFSGHGWVDAGYGSVPGMGETWNQLWDGMPRSFAQAPDFILINQGTNDGSTIVTSTVTAVLNGLLAATPASTKIILLRPYGGAAASSIQGGIAACSAPGRCYYVNTSGWYRSANSADGLHPYGIEHITRLAPLTVDAIRNTLAAAAVLTARTVSITMGDASGPAANLSGIEVSFFDEATPGDHSVARFKTKSETTDASGLMTFSVQSALAVGAIGCAVVRLPDGRNLVRSVAVA